MDKNQFKQEEYTEDINTTHHRVFAVISTIICLPIGLFALFNSFQVDKLVKEEHYEDAKERAKLVKNSIYFSLISGLFGLYAFRELINLL